MGHMTIRSSKHWKVVGSIPPYPSSVRCVLGQDTSPTVFPVGLPLVCDDYYQMHLLK